MSVAVASAGGQPDSGVHMPPADFGAPGEPYSSGSHLRIWSVTLSFSFFIGVSSGIKNVLST
jgi:hypothetical protein